MILFLLQCRSPVLALFDRTGKSPVWSLLGKSRHPARAPGTTRLTHSDRLPASIDALQKQPSITSAAATGSVCGTVTRGGTIPTHH